MVALVTRFAGTNLRWVLRALPQQAGVYLARRLVRERGLTSPAPPVRQKV